jgi:hypothetical protein
VRAHVPYLVTGDTQLIRNVPIPALTPAKMLQLMKSFEA